MTKEFIISRIYTYMSYEMYKTIELHMHKNNTIDKLFQVHSLKVTIIISFNVKIKNSSHNFLFMIYYQYLVIIHSLYISTRILNEQWANHCKLKNLYLMINFSSSFCSSRPCFVTFMHLTFKRTIIQNYIFIWTIHYNWRQ